MRTLKLGEKLIKPTVNDVNQIMRDDAYSASNNKMCKKQIEELLPVIEGTRS